MASFTVVLVLSLACASCTAVAPQGAKYPAGLDPNLCPNYPYCDPIQIISRAEAPNNKYIYKTEESHSEETEPDDDGALSGFPGYPAGVDPKVCPNYPFCGPTPAQVSVPVNGNFWSPQNTIDSWTKDSANDLFSARFATNAQKQWNRPQSRVSWSAPADPAPFSQTAQNTWSTRSTNNVWNHYNPSMPYLNAVQTTSTAQAIDPSTKGGAKYPAGVDPNTCPNYPYCY